MTIGNLHRTSSQVQLQTHQNSNEQLPTQKPFVKDTLANPLSPSLQRDKESFFTWLCNAISYFFQCLFCCKKKEPANETTKAESTRYISPEGFQEAYQKAVKDLDFSFFEDFIRNASNINDKDKNGKNILFYLYDLEALCISKQIDSKAWSTVDHLLWLVKKREIKVNEHENVNGNTLLHLVKHCTMATDLIKCGAYANALNKDHNTPLHVTNDSKIAFVLIDEGNADITIKDAAGNTAFEHHFKLAFKEPIGLEERNNAHLRICETILRNRKPDINWKLDGKSLKEIAIEKGWALFGIYLDLALQRQTKT